MGTFTILAVGLQAKYTQIPEARQDKSEKKSKSRHFFAENSACSRKYLHPGTACASIPSSTRQRLQHPGWVAERFNAAVLKTAEG